MICVSEEGENSIAVAGGSNDFLSRVDLAQAREAISGGAIMLVQLEVPLEAVEAAIELAVENGVPVILNPAPAVPLPDSLLRKVSLLTPNETECEILSGVKVTDEESALRGAEVLLAKGVKTVVMTLGKRGALIASADLRQWVPGYVVKAVDTTAAGDVFNGALAVSLAEGNALLESVQFANAAAAISVTRFGAQTSVPLRGEILSFQVPHDE